MELSVLLSWLEQVADREHDGHVTIMRFTTGWKVMFGTPALEPDQYDPLFRNVPYEPLPNALVRALKERTVWDKKGS